MQLGDAPSAAMNAILQDNTVRSNITIINLC